MFIAGTPLDQRGIVSLLQLVWLRQGRMAHAGRVIGPLSNGLDHR
jgi:hypothetical protein